MPTLKRCKLAWYVAGSPKLAFHPLVQPHAHASTTISYTQMRLHVASV